MSRSISLCLAALVALSVSPALSAQQPLAITVDDLPAHGQLPPGETRLSVAQSLLKTFHDEKLPPVYGFVNAKRVEEAPASLEALKAWRAAGEPLASHTFSHPDLDDISAAEFEADIAKNEELLKGLADDTDWHYLRYPFLHEGDTLAKRQEVQRYLQEHGYKVAEVTLDFEDYLWNNPYARCMTKKDTASVAELERTYLATADQYIGVFREATEKLYGHQIPFVLLMHIGAFDAHMMPKLIALFLQRGFTFTTLQEAQKDPAYAHDPAIGYRGGGALQELEAAARKMKFPPNSKPYKELDAMCR